MAPLPFSKRTLFSYRTNTVLQHKRVWSQTLGLDRASRSRLSRRSLSTALRIACGLSGGRPPRFLRRSNAGDLLGLYPHAGEPLRLYTAPLVPNAKPRDPLAPVDFFDDGGRLLVRS